MLNQHAVEIPTLPVDQWQSSSSNSWRNAKPFLRKSSVVKEATTFEMEMRGHNQVTGLSHERTKNSNPSTKEIYTTKKFEFESAN